MTLIAAALQEANVRFSWASIRLMKRCILTKAPGLLRGQDVLASCRCCMAAPKSPLSSIMSFYFFAVAQAYTSFVDAPTR